MAFRYVMVDYNKIEDTFDLYCYEGNDCVLEEKFDTQEEAQAQGNRYLDGELKDNIEAMMGVPA